MEKESGSGVGGGMDEREERGTSERERIEDEGKLKVLIEDW